MKRGPIVHGVLLVVVLIFAYKTWTREKKTEPTIGKVTVWSKPSGSLTALLFETKDRTVRVEQRAEGADEYLWGKEIRVTRKRKRPKPRPKPPKDAGADATQPEEPEAPEEEIVTTTREFPAGDKADEAFKHFTNLKALRNLGDLDDEARKKYGVAASTDNITAVFSDGERSLILGGKVYGSQDRYVLDTKTNIGYALAGTVVQSLSSGESALRVKNLHKYKDDQVAKARVIIATGGERNLVRTTVKGAKRDTKTWADEATPDKPDQTMANFLDQIKKVKPSRYFPDVDAKALTLLLTVEYRDASGTELGRFEMYKDVQEPEPEPEGKDAEAGKPGEEDAAKKDAAKKDAAKKDAAKKDAAKKDAAKKDPKKDAKKGDDKDAAKKAEEKAAAAEAKKKKPKIEYYVRTERTRVLGKVGKRQAERIESDLAQIFE